MSEKIFITGIDTNVGKTIFTGFLAKNILQKDKKVITHKIVQTGCTNFSEDIKIHREIMGINMSYADKKNMTCPYVLKFPASPHLSAKLENKRISIKKIIKTIQKLEDKYNYILIEGAGGLLVPLNEKETILDLIKYEDIPIILLTYGKLGSINHTLMSLEIIKQNKIELKALVYNDFFKQNNIIESDSKEFFKKYIKKKFPKSKFIEFKNISSDQESYINSDLLSLLKN